MITVGSACTGYGGLEMAAALALNRPLEVRWQAEVEAELSQLLKQDEPDVPNLGDITKRRILTEHELDVDLLLGGIPCQPISEQGLKGGEDDPRYLWPHFVDIVHAARPAGIFMENVSNLVRMNGGRMLQRWLGDLRAAGYAVRWTVMGACTVGAPHHRHRWFAVAARMPAGRPAPEAVRVGTKELCGAARRGDRKLLPSPRASDYQRGSEPTRAQRTGTGGTLLDAVTPLAPGDWGRFAPAVSLWEGIFGRWAPTPTEPGTRHSRRLDARLPEWMMGLPPGFLSGRMSWQAAVRAAGNGVCPQQAAAAYRLLTVGTLPPYVNAC